MKNKILNNLKPFKIPLIILGIFLLLLIIFGKIIPFIIQANASKTPIVSITAENETIYKKNEKIKIRDFKVKAKHEDGKVSTLDNDDYDISTKNITKVGNTTKVIISLKKNKDIKCEVKVKSEREKIVGFQCGYPDVTKVKAVLYSNGELCFEGKGDTLVFDKGKFPWLKYDEIKDYPIESISFQDSVKPTNMNYWFEGIKTLAYISPIPQSVKTMVGTFSDCNNLEVTADMSQCTELLNISNIYEGCDELFNTYPIPACVTTAIKAFKDCETLQNTPDMTNAISLLNAEGMFMGCKQLTGIKMAPNLTNMSEMFKDCINLKDMPQIPNTVIFMEETFKNSLSLTNLTVIPENVNELANCFSGCEMANGNLTINTNTENYSGIFSGAAIATKINLTGKSKKLHYYANESDTYNVFVNGNQPKIIEYD